MTPDAAHGSGTALATASARCPACQLQLCKSRDERPHAQLKEIAREELPQSTVYDCQVCGATLTRSADVARPGWAQQRRRRAASAESPFGRIRAET